MSSPLSHSRLFHDMEIGQVKLSHRVVMASLTRYRNDEENIPLSIAKDYYVQRASVPGTLIVSEAISPSLRSAGLHPNQPGIWSEEQIAAWRQITDAVHAKGCFMFAQLFAAGRAADPSLLSRHGLAVKGPSAIKIDDDQHGVPEVLTESEIEGLIGDFAQGARNAMQRAGFDGVEVHAAYGTLIDQFCHTSSNQRNDAWGGDVERRARFAIEVSRAVCDAVGNANVGIRFSPYSTYLGVTSQDVLPQFVHIVAKLKQLSLAWLHLVEPRMDGIFETARNGTIRPIMDAWGPDMPIIVNGGYTPSNLENAVERDYGGFKIAISFGRCFIANPDLPFRLKNDIELNPYDRLTFYAAKQPQGYIDYAFSPQFKASGELQRLIGLQSRAKGQDLGPFPSSSSVQQT
jgi:NADPH2 dehydrogenase